MSDPLLEELREQYRDGARVRVAEVEALLERVDAETLPQLTRHFHAFAGMGATYGFPRISALGDELEGSILALVRSEAMPDAATLARWRDVMREIARELC